MQIESVELVKSVILKKQFLQMIPLAAEEGLFCSPLLFHRKYTLIESKGHSPFMDTSACSVEAMLVYPKPLEKALNSV